MGLIVFFGALIRFLHLGRYVFYWDEPLHCVRIAAQPLPFVLSQNDASAFFTLLVHMLLPLGQPEVMARLASGVFGVGTIVAAYFLGKEIFSEKEGLLASLLVAFSPLLIRYSQYSRAYSVYIFLSTAALFFFIKAFRTNRNRYWVFFGAAMALNIYNHLFSAFLFAVFGLYAGSIALTAVLRKKGQNGKKDKIRGFLKFFFCAFCVLAVVVVLYLPDKAVQNFVSDSLLRAVGSVPEESPAAFPVQETFTNLLAPFDSVSLVLLLFLAAAGFLALIKKEVSLSVCAFLYMAVPYIVFLIIRPTPAHMLSLWRYMAYALPLLLLLVAKGLFVLVSAFSILLKKTKISSRKRGMLRNTAAGVLIVFVLLRGFAHKSFYLEFQRLNALRTPKEVSSVLRSGLGEDAFIHFDSFPASGLIMVANPLSRDLGIEEIELAVREGRRSDEGDPEILLYRVRKLVLEWYAQRGVDLWAVTRSGPEKNNSSIESESEGSSFRILAAGENTILHFNDPQTPLWKKLDVMTGFLLRSGPDAETEKDLHLIAARALLIGGEFDSAVRHLELSRNQSQGAPRQETARLPLYFRTMDRLFGLNEGSLREASRKMYLYSDIARLLFPIGDGFRRAKMYGKALTAYSECAALSSEFDPQIVRRLSQVANTSLFDGNLELARSYIKKAVEIDPDSPELGFLLFEIHRKSGRPVEALEDFTRFFYKNSLSPDDREKLLHADPLLIILRKDSAVYFLFRAEKRAIFSGDLTSARKIKGIRTGLAERNDSVRFLKKRLAFRVELSGESVKIMAVTTPEKSELTIDPKVTGLTDASKILILDGRSFLGNTASR